MIEPVKAKSATADNEHDLSCLCGRLVARWVDGAVELRCQRCKRTLRLELLVDGQGRTTIRVAPAS